MAKLKTISVSAEKWLIEEFLLEYLEPFRCVQTIVMLGRKQISSDSF